MTITRRSLLGAAAALVLGTPAAQAQEVTLRLHQFLPAQANVPANILIPWTERVETASGGRIAIQHFPAMQMGGAPSELADQVIDGVADIVWTVAGYTPGRFPRAEVMELPFFMNAYDTEAASRAYWQLAEEMMMDADFAEMKILGLWVHGPGIIHTSEPVREIADLRGVKLRAPTRTTNTLFGDLGATPVGMPVPAVPENLSRGVIDGAVIPWEVTGALRIPELVANHTEFGDAALYTTAFIFAMNRDRYESLPEDLRAVMDAHSGLEFSGFAGRQMQIDDGPARQVAVDLGNTIITLGPDEVAEWKEASRPTVEAWIAEMDDHGLDGAGLVARATALLEQNRGITSEF